VILSEVAPEFIRDCVALERHFKSQPDGGSVVDVEVLDELNGGYAEFGERFWAVVSEKQPGIDKLLTNHKLLSLQYCDRYIQNPVAIALLGSIVEPLKKVMLKDSKFDVVTLFRQNAAARWIAFVDWT